MMTIDNYQDIIDVRDIIEHAEDHENRDPNEDTHEDVAEYAIVATLLGQLRGNGGDEQWRGDWYPITLIRDSYFTSYAQELADDIGGEGRNNWPYNCVDWNQAARELQMDYSTVEFNGVTYWYR